MLLFACQEGITEEAVIEKIEAFDQAFQNDDVAKLLTSFSSDASIYALGMREGESTLTRTEYTKMWKCIFNRGIRATPLLG